MVPVWLAIPKGRGRDVTNATSSIRKFLIKKKEKEMPWLDVDIKYFQSSTPRCVVCRNPTACKAVNLKLTGMNVHFRKAKCLTQHSESNVCCFLFPTLAFTGGTKCNLSPQFLRFRVWIRIILSWDCLRYGWLSLSCRRVVAGLKTAAIAL